MGGEEEEVDSIQAVNEDIVYSLQFTRAPVTICAKSYLSLFVAVDTRTVVHVLYLFVTAASWPDQFQVRQSTNKSAR